MPETLQEIDDLLLDAEGHLRQAIDACERLAKICDEQNLGENGGASLRMNRYILPHLSSWLYDDNQMGSLASIRDEIGLGE